MPWTGPAELFEHIAACIGTLGEPVFQERFLALMRHAARSEQCMILAYGQDDRVDCLLAANERDPSVAVQLAHRYVSGEFRRDPNYAALRHLSDLRWAFRPVRA